MTFILISVGMILTFLAAGTLTLALFEYIRWTMGRRNPLPNLLWALAVTCACLIGISIIQIALRVL